MSDRIPIAADPREFVRDELTARGINSRALPLTIRLWYAGEEPMPGEVAEALAREFDTSAEMWLNLDRSWQRWKETRDE